MVQVIQYSPQKAAAEERMRSGIANAFNQSNELALENQRYERDKGRLQKALAEVQSQAAKPGASQLGTTLSFLQAMAAIPGSERYVSTVLPQLLQQAQAETSQNVDYTGSQGQPIQQGQRESFNVPQRAPLPELTDKIGNAPIQDFQENKFYPNVRGQQAAPGNLPQAATEGLIRPIKNVNEMFDEARRISKEQTARGFPLPVNEAFDLVKAQNEENKAYNKAVEEERKSRVVSQKEYGKLAVDRLSNIMPNATDEQKAIFKKIGEEAAAENRSEADIDRVISKKVTQFKNTISNVENDISAPRVTNTLQRKFLGTDKEFDEAARDLRVKLKPLLDLGLYDTARKKLSELGYYPEERETIVNPLSEKTQNSLKRLPSVKKPVKIEKGITGMPRSLEEYYTPDQEEILKENLKEILQKDPNASLVLLRKGAEDKNYDWKVFKKAIQDIKESGEVPNFPNEDQFNQLNYLDSPPLNTLEKILYKLNLQGR